MLDLGRKTRIHFPMSRTRRGDSIDVTPPCPDFVLFGEVVSCKRTKDEIARAHRDGKHGPGSIFKKCQRKRDSVKPKHVLVRALAQGRDLDDLVLPDPKKHDRWDFY